MHEISARAQRLKPEFDEHGIRLWALSADPLERAAEQARHESFGVPILAGLQQDEMRRLGLYISSPRSSQETDRNFAEPAAFVINPESKVQIVDVSNAPFARPDPPALLGGIRFLIENGYPVRGTAD